MVNKTDIKEGKKFSIDGRIGTAYAVTDKKIEEGFVDLFFETGRPCGLFRIDKLDYVVPTKEEVKTYLKEWGQSHREICTNLDYDPKTSDDLLMEDYFWMENKRQWYPKLSRMYSEREQEIATYLRENR
jgi:hypothetical protein